MSTDPFWQTAERVCTPKQLEIIRLKHRDGLSLRAIAFTLDIGLSTVRDHLARAEQKIELALRDDFFKNQEPAA